MGLPIWVSEVVGLPIWVGCGGGAVWGCRSGLGVVVCLLVLAWWWSRGCGYRVADVGWVWWFAFWSQHGGRVVGVIVGLPIWVGCGGGAV